MKHTFFVIVLFTVFTSCNNQTPKSMETSENVSLIKKYFDLFNKHQWKEMAGLYNETADFKDPSLGPGIVKQTREQIIGKYSELSTTFPDVKDEIVQIYPSGEKHVIVEFISTGTAPDHSKFELPICTIFTIENGKITGDFTYYDNFEEPAE